MGMPLVVVIIIVVVVLPTYYNIPSILVGSFRKFLPVKRQFFPPCYWQVLANVEDAFNRWVLINLIVERGLRPTLYVMSTSVVIWSYIDKIERAERTDKSRKYNTNIFVVCYK